MLRGEEFNARDKTISELDALIARRQVRALALKIGQSKQHRLATERAGEIWASHFTEIAAVEKQRVLRLSCSE